MDNRELLQDILKKTAAGGADKTQVSVSNSRKHEFTINHGEVALLRTTFNTGLGITVIKDNKKGSVSLNKTDAAAADEAVTNALMLADASQPDPAHDIAAVQDAAEFSKGSAEPDLDTAYDRIGTFLAETKKRYPDLILEESVLDFTHTAGRLMNSNGVDFATARGGYGFWAMFAARKGQKSSSFNYTGFSSLDLGRELLDCGTLDTIMGQTCGQLDLTAIDGKFEGDILITPDCLDNFIGYFSGTYLGDHALITGTSPLKDKLGQQVVSPDLTVRCEPRSDEMAGGYFLTGDGFAAQDSVMIEKGVLNHFNLGLYGANKTGQQRSVNSGGAWVVDPGTSSYDDCVKKIKRGIMLCRFSGGSPNNNGDFSGVAKNSYYIEDGEIKYPVAETMISGNLVDLFSNIKSISQERINYGSAILPWMVCGGVTVSGK